jgi:hypothetical protein
VLGPLRLIIFLGQQVIMVISGMDDHPQSQEDHPDGVARTNDQYCRYHATIVRFTTRTRATKRW